MEFSFQQQHDPFATTPVSPSPLDYSFSCHSPTHSNDFFSMHSFGSTSSRSSSYNVDPFAQTPLSFSSSLSSDNTDPLDFSFEQLALSRKPSHSQLPTPTSSRKPSRKSSHRRNLSQRRVCASEANKGEGEGEGEMHVSNIDVVASPVKLMPLEMDDSSSETRNIHVDGKSFTVSTQSELDSLLFSLNTYALLDGEGNAICSFDELSAQKTYFVQPITTSKVAGESCSLSILKTKLGFAKNVAKWTFVEKNEAHTVEVHHSAVSGKRKFVVDGITRLKEKNFWTPSCSRVFGITEDGPKILRLTISEDGNSFIYNLFVNGVCFGEPRDEKEAVQPKNSPEGKTRRKKKTNSESELF